MKWEAEIAAFLQTKGISVMEDSVVAKRWYWWGNTLERFYDLYSPPYLWQYPFSEDETGNIQLLHIYLFSLCSSFQNNAKVHENNNLRQQEEKDRAAVNLLRVPLQLCQCWAGGALSATCTAPVQGQLPLCSTMCHSFAVCSLTLLIWLASLHLPLAHFAKNRCWKSKIACLESQMKKSIRLCGKPNKSQETNLGAQLTSCWRRATSSFLRARLGLLCILGTLIEMQPGPRNKVITMVSPQPWPLCLTHGLQSI